MNKNTTTLTAAALLIGVTGFFGGIKYKDYQLQKQQVNMANGNLRGSQILGNTSSGGTNRNGANRFLGEKPVQGEIINMEDKSITVKMPDGSTKIVILTDSTSFSKTDTGSKEDLKQGSQIGVFGTNNSDGSVTAQNIQLNPMFRSFPSPTPKN